MYKLLTFSGYDSSTGPHIFPIEADVNKTIGHIKMARPLPPDIEHYIRSAKPIAGKTQLLIDAMGAGEFYGSNVNGDYFPEVALSHKGSDYGYETFMHYAYPYKHHVNKDPARAYGEKVALASYDPNMHRVLLIIRVDDSKCQDILGDLSNGTYWDVSMGCKVPWDECSICKNRARNRAEYCPHLRYQMNKILSDGRRVFAYNWLPKFFDISFVTIGAEKASHVLKKVAMSSVGITERGLEPGGHIKASAEIGEHYYAKLSAEEKAAVQRKNAEIDKDVPSAPPANISGVTSEDKAKLTGFMDDASAVKSNERSIPPGALDALAQFPLKDIFATLVALGIDLKPEEFQRIILVKQGAAALANKLAARRLVFDETRPAATMPKWAAALRVLTEHDVSEKVAMVLYSYIEDRSCYPEVLLNRLERMEKQGGVTYKRDSQWYPMTDDEKRRSSGIQGLVPASLALAAGFMVFRRHFPSLMSKAPSPLRALSKHPWLLPLLMSAGVGASVGLSTMSSARQITPHGTGSGLDGGNARAYHGTKTASMNPVAQLGLIPLAYIYAGNQQQRCQSNAPSTSFDRLASLRPDVLDLTKHSSAPGTTAMYAAGSSASAVPSSIVGASIDTRIFNATRRLASRKKE